MSFKNFYHICYVSLTLTLTAIITSCDNSNKIINDKDTNLQWTAISPNSMTWSEAKKYCSNLILGTKDDWRLPTASELKTILNFESVDADSEIIEEPFQGPFITEKQGYLFTTTPVKGYTDAVYVMNLRNGHIFNGQGYSAFARCVRNNRFD